MDIFPILALALSALLIADLLLPKFLLEQMVLMSKDKKNLSWHLVVGIFWALTLLLMNYSALVVMGIE